MLRAEKLLLTRHELPRRRSPCHGILSQSEAFERGRVGERGTGPGGYRVKGVLAQGGQRGSTPNLATGPQPSPRRGEAERERVGEVISIVAGSIPISVTTASLPWQSRTQPHRAPSNRASTHSCSFESACKTPCPSPLSLSLSLRGRGLVFCSQAKKAKQAEIDRKRAEVRKRLEEASKAKKAKKGFMTPERKKKLRLLLRKKAAEELKKEQERKAAERRRIIEERCGKPKNIEDANEETIKRVIKDYYARTMDLEDAKFDLEYAVKKKDYEGRSCGRTACETAKLPVLSVSLFPPANLKSILNAYYKRINSLEEEKYDHEVEVARKDLEVCACAYVRACSCVTELQTICMVYWNKIAGLEGDKFDLEHTSKIKAMEVKNDGKFVASVFYCAYECPD
ncbi:hypothetical protein PR048_027296 [Dryococelus australis]|uniref:Troponin I n=1 Tax=Dryococelus australis TaxID=614101 RepID=A0ABQ9GF96_9NEOP|nr:hypothetical protein PR048_027296 [Dryococelus australis]